MTTPDNKDYIDIEIAKYDDLIVGFFNYFKFMKIEGQMSKAENKYHIFSHYFDEYNGPLKDPSYRNVHSKDVVLNQLKNMLKDMRYHAQNLGLAVDDITDEKLKGYAVIGRLEVQEEDKTAELMRRSETPDEEISSFRLFGGGGKIH